MHTSKFFTAEKVYDNVTAIGGLGGELCYLVEGSQRAVLIDTLTGVGSLKAFVRELTDLPVEVVNTHGHVDHCGGNFEYGACRIHPADIGLMYEHGDPQRRLQFVQKGSGYAALPQKPGIEDVIPLCPVKTLPIWEGEVLDLGGFSLEVIGVPGHSLGSLVLLDRAHRTVYAGDACNANTLLFLEGSTTIEAYKDSLLHWSAFLPDFDVLYGGHGLHPVPKEIIPQAIALCDEIMAGTDDALPQAFLGRPCLYAKAKNEFFQREDGGLPNIAYAKDRIWDKQ